MDRKTYTPEEIQKRFDALPSDIKALVYSADMLRLIQKIGGKHQLHVDQLGSLEAETADVMSGFSRPEDFISNIEQSLQIDHAKAEAVAKDVNDMLFVKIRESLKKLYETSEGAPRAEAAERPAIYHLPLEAKGSAPQPEAPVQPHPTSSPQPAHAQKPPVPHVAHPNDTLLTHKTVTVPPPAPAAPRTPASAPAPAPAKPAGYKTDPYREPPL